MKTEDVRKHDSTERSPGKPTHMEVKCHLKMPYFTLPELVDNRTTYCSSACMWKYIHNFSWSFNNSKYFKTAVKSIVTISSKIVSHEKNIF